MYEVGEPTAKTHKDEKLELSFSVVFLLLLE